MGRDQVMKREDLGGVVDGLLHSYARTRLDTRPRPPSRQSIEKIVEQLRRLLFPGYYADENVPASSLRYHVGTWVCELQSDLSRAIRRALVHYDAQPADRAARLYRHLQEIEWELAARARAQAGANQLLEALRQRGRQLGILTRNSQEIAYETLRVCDLLEFFDRECVLARESATPKPGPDGIRQLLSHWAADPSAAVMVGDYLYDLMAGHRAGTATVYVDIRGSGKWAAHADVTVRDLVELRTLAVAQAEV